MIGRPGSPRPPLAVQAPSPTESNGYEISVRSSHGRVLVQLTGCACEYLKLGSETLLEAVARSGPLVTQIVEGMSVDLEIPRVTLYAGHIAAHRRERH